MDRSTTNSTITDFIDCACVIHGDVYTWNYVDRLYNMLSRNLTPKVRLHVYTEPDRSVPAPYIKHSLTDWGIGGAKKSWWYKMQLFDPAHHAGPLLYFDLDTVIVANIDWIWQNPLRYFWAIRDFKHLWRPTHQGLNSSVMWWHTVSYEKMWQNFQKQPLKDIMRRYQGDQDYLSKELSELDLRFFNEQRIRSWRWQCLDGGFDFRIKAHREPGAGTKLSKHDSVLVFHGHPKPNELSNDVVIKQHWH